MKQCMEICILKWFKKSNFFFESHENMLNYHVYKIFSNDQIIKIFLKSLVIFEKFVNFLFFRHFIIFYIRLIQGRS